MQKFNVGQYVMANIGDFLNAYILECIASRKIWKRAPDETQWESEYVSKEEKE